ncbi:replication-relaxation family protein [Streptomyces sp. AM 4-1-1]|nr:replication-relaxation family protein [Streptomyces sp. AM 4-1-1]WEH33623.1 replication-relaxation family protein [Streptomyces sp. AM 4-1-1]
MELTTRDLTILSLVHTFTQLSSTHLKELVFFDRSHSVPDVVLGRLTRLRYLSRVGRRATGLQGGSGAYTYQLGRYGRTLLGVEGRLSPNVNNHALMIADTYLELRRAEKAGVLNLTRWEIELPVPPSVRADLFVAVDFPQQQRSGAYFLEIDLSTEAPIRIREKIQGYWRAAESSEANDFPFVVFVVRHEARKAEIGRIIRGLPAEQQEMVRVFLFAELIPQLIQL